MIVIEPIDKKLNTAIMMKQEEMLEYARRYGMTDPRTVTCSQQLDRILNKQENSSFPLAAYSLETFSDMYGF
ncbi:Spo0E family sporulation regulatory protein-aspartic acid phosphatase [Oceanobacillus kapialis]|uniref:Spo0E family sporulation regulatory protein-aspartic acid phosphatase n=1 Tax=Oceanobacillus kapialis TaxID=481353 RepID=A0ABW5Q1Z0_9BACI